ncbi:MAG: hypothetical protein AAGF82_00765 [Pseudomonadota bacterium]
MSRLSKRKLVLAITPLLAVIAVGVFMIGSILRDRLTVIVLRDTDTVEIYAKLPADKISSVLGVQETVLTGDDGLVRYSDYLEGTWTYAEDISAKLEPSFGDETAALEGMSLMVHPQSYNLPFRDMVDAAIAISVCDAASRQPTSDLSNLDIYAGYIAFTEAAGDPIRIGFPETGRLPVLTLTREFRDGTLVKTSWKILWDGQALMVL